jgi:DNA-directed RNA polymerase specialized sigma24 family protein
MGGRDGFEQFVQAHEARLRTALVLTYGPDAGREAAAEALAWAWEHWDRVAMIDSPVPYLYRVGQSRTRRIRRPTPTSRFRTEVNHDAP